MENETTADQLIPSCETTYRDLLAQEANQKQYVENRKTNLEALDKLLSVWLQEMDYYHNDNYVPRSASYLYSNAGIDESVYERNFGNMNGVLIFAKTEFLRDIDSSAIGPFGGFSYDMAIKRLFEYFAHTPDTPEIDCGARIRADFALRRFHDDVWGAALHRLYPLVTESWSKYDFATKEFMFSWFVASLKLVLLIWGKHGFSADMIDQCKTMLKAMAFPENLRLQMVEDATGSFSHPDNSVVL